MKRRDRVTAEREAADRATAELTTSGRATPERVTEEQVPKTSRGRKLRRVGGAVIAVGLAAAVGAATALRAGREVAPPPPEAAVAVPVRVNSAASLIGDFGLVATGTLAPSREVRIGFAVPGVVDRIYAREGDTVIEGALLASLDAAPYRAGADEARARTTFLHARMLRTRTLADSGAATTEELDGEVAELAVAEALSDRAEWNWQRTALRAPFSGELRADRIEVGQVVEAGDHAFDLIAVDSLDISVSVAIVDLARIDPDARVEVAPLDLPGILGRGRVVHRPVSGDPRTTAVPIRVRVANPDRQLLAGTVAEVRFQPRRGHELPSVPLSSLRVRSDSTTVFVVESGRARSRIVETGTIRERNVQLVSGLGPHEIVIVEPPDRLRDGDPVHVVRED